MLIVVEGIDMGGKTTQFNLLVEKLKREGKDVVTESFPTHERTFFGGLVSKYLRGEFGKLNELTPEVPSLLYGIDRYHFKDRFNNYLKEGKIIVLDRYWFSNVGHQGSKFEGQERKEFVKWLELVDSRMPQADIVVFLDIPVEVSTELLKQREEKEYLQGKKGDIHEEDTEHLKKTRDSYLEFAETQNNWIIVNCTEQEKLRPIQDIHNEIWEKIKDKIK